MTVVAVVDDHLLLAQMVARGLDGEGITAHVIDVDHPIVEQLQELCPAVAVLDLQLGDHRPQGTDLVAPLHELGATVLMLTGVNNDVELAKCLAAGADGVIQKTESIDLVVEQVKQAIDDRATDPASNEHRTELLPGRSDRAAYDQLLTSHQRQAATAAARFSSLTKREQQVLGGLMGGQSPAAIADGGYVSIATVRSQIKSLMRKLEVHTQLEAVAAAHNAGWQPVDG
ncbi:MAG: response regulator transcription factor [Acidimicrobiales bacterium]|nr:response regulator transcription factor [Acidimicrobiales bacterium]